MHEPRTNLCIVENSRRLTVTFQENKKIGFCFQVFLESQKLHEFVENDGETSCLQFENLLNEVMKILLNQGLTLMEEEGAVNTSQ